jgi:hypothetical protein
MLAVLGHAKDAKARMLRIVKRHFWICQIGSNKQRIEEWTTFLVSIPLDFYKVD